MTLNCATCGERLTSDDVPRDPNTVAHCRACVRDLQSDAPPKWLAPVAPLKSIGKADVPFTSTQPRPPALPEGSPDQP